MWFKTIIIGWAFNGIPKNQGLRYSAALFPDIPLAKLICLQRKAWRREQAWNCFALLLAPFPWSLMLFHQSFAFRVVTKIASCWIHTTSRWRIKQLGISFGSSFLLFSNKSSRGPHSYQLGEIPSPQLLMTALRISRSPLFLTQVQENKAPEEVRADKNWI